MDNVPLVVKVVPSFFVTRKVTLLLELLTEVTSSRRVEEIAPPLSVPEVVAVGVAAYPANAGNEERLKIIMTKGKPDNFMAAPVSGGVQ
jgi:hypothetical protein